MTDIGSTPEFSCIESWLMNNNGESLPSEKTFEVIVLHAPPKFPIGPAKLHLLNGQFYLLGKQDNTYLTTSNILGHWKLSQLKRFGKVANKFCFQTSATLTNEQTAGVFVLATVDDPDLIEEAFKKANYNSLTPVSCGSLKMTPALPPHTDNKIVDKKNSSSCPICGDLPYTSSIKNLNDIQGSDKRKPKAIIKPIHRTTTGPLMSTMPDGPRMCKLKTVNDIFDSRNDDDDDNDANYIGSRISEENLLPPPPQPLLSLKNHPSLSSSILCSPSHLTLPPRGGTPAFQSHHSWEGCNNYDNAYGSLPLKNIKRHLKSKAPSNNNNSNIICNNVIPPIDSNKNSSIKSKRSNASLVANSLHNHTAAVNRVYPNSLVEYTPPKCRFPKPLTQKVTKATTKQLDGIATANHGPKQLHSPSQSSLQHQLITNTCSSLQADSLSKRYGIVVNDIELPCNLPNQPLGETKPRFGKMFAPQIMPQTDNRLTNGHKNYVEYHGSHLGSNTDPSNSTDQEFDIYVEMNNPGIEKAKNYGQHNLVTDSHAENDSLKTNDCDSSNSNESEYVEMICNLAFPSFASKARHKKEAFDEKASNTKSDTDSNIFNNIYEINRQNEDITNINRKNTKSPITTNLDYSTPEEEEKGDLNEEESNNLHLEKNDPVSPTCRFRGCKCQDYWKYLPVRPFMPLGMHQHQKNFGKNTSQNLQHSTPEHRNRPDLLALNQNGHDDMTEEDLFEIERIQALYKAKFEKAPKFTENDSDDDSCKYEKPNPSWNKKRPPKKPILPRRQSENIGLKAELSMESVNIGPSKNQKNRRSSNQLKALVNNFLSNSPLILTKLTGPNLSKSGPEVRIKPTSKRRQSDIGAMGLQNNSYHFLGPVPETVQDCNQPGPNMQKIISSLKSLYSASDSNLLKSPKNQSKNRNGAIIYVPTPLEDKLCQIVENEVIKDATNVTSPNSLIKTNSTNTKNAWSRRNIFSSKKCDKKLESQSLFKFPTSKQGEVHNRSSSFNGN